MMPITKNIVVLMCFCIILGGINPRRDMLSIPCETVAGVLADQPLVQCYFSLSNLPVKIVSKMFFDNTAGDPAANNRSKGDRDGNENNSSSDYSLASAGKSGAGRYSPGTGNNGPGVVLEGESFGHKGGFGSEWAAGALRYYNGLEILLMLLLMLFVLLPRSGIEDSLCAAGKYASLNPIWKCPNRDFYFGGEQ